MTDEVKLPLTSGVEPEVRAALDRAQAHLDAGDLTTALGDCDTALGSAPEWAEAHNLRGIVLDALGRTGEAIASYQEALRLEPTFADAAKNLNEVRAETGRRWPLRKRMAAVALPLVIVAAVVVTVAVLQARRGLDWRLTVNEYIAQRAQAQGLTTVRSMATASHPASFVAAMGRLVPGGVLWEGISPIFPPRAVQCVVLEIGAGGGRQLATAPRVTREVVYVTYHSDGLHHLGWRVYEAGQAPFAPQLVADLHTIGCDLPLQ